MSACGACGFHRNAAPTDSGHSVRDHDRGFNPGLDGGLRLPLDPTQPLDLEITFTCGQIFRWRREGEWWCGTLGGTALALRCVDSALEVRQAGTALGGGGSAAGPGLGDELARGVRP